MEKWMLNAERITFEMTDMHVVWFAHQWNRQYPIISGEDETLFIIDAKAGYLYTLSFGVMVKTRIWFQRDHDTKPTRCFITRHGDKPETTKLHLMEPEDWMYLMQLVVDCPQSRRWLMREQMRLIHK